MAFFPPSSVRVLLQPDNFNAAPPVTSFCDRKINKFCITNAHFWTEKNGKAFHRKCSK